MAINDLIDAPLDLKVKRTETDLLHQGIIKTSCIFLNHSIIFELLIDNFILHYSDKFLYYSFCIFLPACKKNFKLSSTFLGIVFNWGNNIYYAPVNYNRFVKFIFCRCIPHIGYDTIYAFQDIEDDTKQHRFDSKKIKNYPSQC